MSLEDKTINTANSNFTYCFSDTLRMDRFNLHKL